MIIGVVGMSHLGLVTAAAFGGQGFETLCFDADTVLLDRIKAGDLPVREPGLAALIAQNGARQSFTGDFARLAQCDVVYIARDVPTDDDAQSDLGDVRTLIEQTVPRLGPEAVLVVLCQVPPGFTRAVAFDPARLYYQVETLVFGNAVERATQPERFIVGCADPARPLPDAYRAVLQSFDCPILAMGYESAELAKISINFCLVASISVANTLAELCEQIGADWHEIVPALKLDRRIGAYSYLSPGLGIAGGNLERDLQTVLRLAGEHHTDAGVIEAWLHNSRYRRDWAVETLRRCLRDGIADPLVAVWGLAYKQDTHSVKNSPSLASLAQMHDLRVRLHDPVVPADVVDHPHAEAADSARAAVAGADALMIMTPWQAYRDVPPGDIAAAMSGRTVIDPYRVLDPAAALRAGLDYHTLGMPAQRAA